jgi:hypothetical protein
MNHTPGPWNLDTVRDLVFHSPEWSDTADDQTEADARLIAAAPDLLAALEDALSYIEDVLADPAQLAAFKPGIVQAHAKAARAAIARATGA